MNSVAPVFLLLTKSLNFQGLLNSDTRHKSNSQKLYSRYLQYKYRCWQSSISISDYEFDLKFPSKYAKNRTHTQTLQCKKKSQFIDYINADKKIISQYLCRTIWPKLLLFFIFLRNYRLFFKSCYRIDRCVGLDNFLIVLLIFSQTKNFAKILLMGVKIRIWQ